MTLTNSGTLLVAGKVASYTGPTFINAGTLKAGIATALAAAGGTVTVGASGTLDLNANALSVGGLAGSGAVINSGAAATLTVGGNNLDSTYSGALQSGNTAANMNLVKSGVGTLTLTGANTYTGTTGVNGGILRLSGGANRLATTTAVTVGNVAGPVSTTLDLQSDQTLSAATALTFYGTTSTNTTEARVNIAGTLTLQGNVSSATNATASNGFLGGWITGGTLMLDGAARTFTIVDSPNAADDLTITSVINTSNGGSLTKAGAGTLTLTGNNTMSGTTLISAGTLRISGTNDASAFNLGTSGAVLNSTGGSATVGSLTGVSGTTVSLGGTLTVGADGTSPAAFAGTVSGVGGLTKTGTGALTLSGTTINYTGATIVNQGTLSVTGSTGAALATSALTVAGGATFNMVNTVAQQFNLGSGALTLGTAAQTATLGFELGANTAASDRIVTTATATTAGTIQFSITALAGFGGASTYDLISATAGLSGASYGVSGSAPGGYVYSFGTSTDALVQLTLTPSTGTVYWGGQLGGSWSSFSSGSTNWWSSIDGTTTNAGFNPGVNNTVIFTTQANAGGAIVTTLDNNYIINDLKFQNNNSGATTSVTINSGTPSTSSLTIAPVSSTDGINIATGSVTTGVTINAPLVLGANQTWNVADLGTTLTLGALGDGGTARTIGKTGSGTVILGAAATLLTSGTVFNVSNGVLIANVTGSLSQVATTANTTTVNVSSTGELRGMAAGSFKSTGASTPSEAISLSAGTLRLSNTATTDFGGNLTYSGGSVILDRTSSGGANTDTMGTLSIGAVTLTPTTANYTANPTLVFGATTLTGSPTFDTTNANMTLGAVGDGSVARTITKQGVGTLSFGANATSLVDGTTIKITAGTLNSNTATALGSLAAVDVADGATLSITGASQTIGSLTNVGTTLNSGIVSIASGFALTVGSTNNLASSFSGVINGAGGLSKGGTNTLTLSGLSSTAANNYTGTTTLGGGTLAITTVDPTFTGGLTVGSAALSTTASALDLSVASATFGGGMLVRTTAAAAGGTLNTITIGSNKTLTVNGSVTIGAGHPPRNYTDIAISGAGTFSIGTSGTPTNANVQLGVNATTNISNNASLDMSGLTNFAAYLGTGSFNVGETSNTGGTGTWHHRFRTETRGQQHNFCHHDFHGKRRQYGDPGDQAGKRHERV